MISTTWSPWLLLGALPLLALLPRTPQRKKYLSYKSERVLILGASSGIGAAIAKRYAARGARVLVVGRRLEQLEAVRLECEALGSGALKAVADFSNVDEVVKVRELVEKEWQGLDTLVICAGVSALQPLMAVAGVTKDEPSAQATREGIERAKTAASAAINGNYLGPLVSAVTFIPLLTQTSAKPAILLMSSIAALFPAPTRTLYCSSKAASHLLFQALAIEHPQISFSLVTPTTVEGSFRASAVDAGPVREHLEHALKREDVARISINAIDRGHHLVYIPAAYKLVNILYAFLPGIITRGASKKYQFQA